jgi:hypothetical protein
MSEVLIEKVNKPNKDLKIKQVMYRLKDTHTENVFDHIKGVWTEREAYPSQRYIANEYQIVKNDELVLKRFAKSKTINPETGAVIPILGTIKFEKALGGVITCDLTTPQGLALNDFLSEHPSNESNPNRNTNEKSIFYKVDNNKEAEAKVKETIGYKDAMVKAFELDLAGLKMFARLLGTPEVVKKSEAELRVIAITQAKDNPERFFDVLDDKDALIKVHIEEAEEAGKIKFDNVTSSWQWESGVNIKAVGKAPKYESLQEFFQSKAGSAQYVKLCEILETLKTK